MGSLVALFSFPLLLFTLLNISFLARSASKVLRVFGSLGVGRCTVDSRAAVHGSTLRLTAVRPSGTATRATPQPRCWVLGGVGFLVALFLNVGMTGNEPAELPNRAGKG